MSDKEESNQRDRSENLPQALCDAWGVIGCCSTTGYVPTEVVGMPAPEADLHPRQGVRFLSAENISKEPWFPHRTHGLRYLERLNPRLRSRC